MSYLQIGMGEEPSTVDRILRFFGSGFSAAATPSYPGYPPGTYPPGVIPPTAFPAPNPLEQMLPMILLIGGGLLVYKIVKKKKAA
jgi:hypothetical protein